jgi:hypothetical protein
MNHLRKAAPTNCKNCSDILAILPSGLVLADVYVVHAAATSCHCAASWPAGAAAASRDALKRRQYHVGGLPAALSLYPLPVKSYVFFSAATIQFLNALAETVLASSAMD